MESEKAPPRADIIRGSSTIARAIKLFYFFPYAVPSGINVASLAKLITQSGNSHQFMELCSRESGRVTIMMDT